MKPLFVGLGAVTALSMATAASGAEYAPVDCAKANTPALRAICRNYSLGQAEARMATLFSITTSLVAMGRRGDLVDTQREWLKTRDACGANVACLSNAYRVRIEQLNAVIADIASRGPF
jgi:uncharacterized protein